MIATCARASIREKSGAQTEVESRDPEVNIVIIRTSNLYRVPGSALHPLVPLLMIVMPGNSTTETAVYRRTGVGG